MPRKCGGDLWYGTADGLFRLPEGGSPELVYHGAGFAAVGAANVYFLEQDGVESLLFRGPLAGGCAVPIAKMAMAVGPPVVDSDHVYVGLSTGAVVSLPQ